MSETSRRQLPGSVPSPGPQLSRRGNAAQLLPGSRCVRVSIPYRNWRRLVSASALVTLLVLPASGSAFEIRQAGKLQVSHNAQLFAFSTDPTIQEILSQDFSAASRSADRGSGSTVTVSVNVTQQMLRPGVSLTQLAPGDPQVADLMRAAGATPPPLGDTGSQYDEAALARRMAARDYMPSDTPMEGLINSMSNPRGSSRGFGPPIPIPCAARSAARPGCPPVPEASPAATATRSIGDVQQYVERRKQTQSLFGFGGNNDYDTVVVARASVSGAPEEMTLVAVSHPGEDVNDAKKYIAERIANSILH
jgi:hypothetical protein